MWCAYYYVFMLFCLFSSPTPSPSISFSYLGKQGDFTGGLNNCMASVVSVLCCRTVASHSLKPHPVLPALTWVKHPPHPVLPVALTWVKHPPHTLFTLEMHIFMNEVFLTEQ